MSKILLRESWEDPTLRWDDLLPQEQVTSWLTFFRLLLELNRIQIPRSLWPEGDVVGSPVLVIFSNGSISAYGVAACIRWRLRSGGYWSRLIVSKSNIGPKHIVSVPRMELCGTLAGNRIKKNSA